MIDYIKLFTEKLNTDFEKCAKHSIKSIAKLRKAGIQHVPPRYKFSDTCTFGLIIDKENEDNQNWADTISTCYVEKIAQTNRRSKIKSIDIKLYKPEDDRPESIPESSDVILFGTIKFTR